MDIEKNIEKLENKVEKTSFAMEMLTYSKEQNRQLVGNFKKMFYVWVITFIGLLCAVGYIVYLLNDISVIEETTTQEVTDIDTINGSVVNKGDIYGED